MIIFVIDSAKLADLISNYQQIITGIEFIINNYKGYYVIYGDGTLIDKIDNYYTTDIHPSTYDTVVSPKLNRYKIKMSKTIFIISDYNDITKTIAKGTPKELLKIIMCLKMDMLQTHNGLIQRNLGTLTGGLLNNIIIVS